MAQTNLPATGQAGIEPPPDAPRETSQPLTGDYIANAQANARANERELAPLTYGRTGAVSDKIAQLEAEIEALKSGNERVPEAVHAPAPVQAAPGYPQPQKYVDAVVKSEFPAASNSDSPSRGLPGTAPIPAERSKPPIQVLGGFGEAEAEYFPLNGLEAKTLAEQLLDELNAILQNDLRFSIAVCYPRLSMKLQLIVEGEEEDQAFEITRILPKGPKDLPLELAQKHADSVVFVVKAQRREFDEAGNSETPADAMRDELGLRKPRKRQIQSGAGKAIVDVTWAPMW